MAIIGRSFIMDLNHKVKVSARYATPVSFTRSGYGKRIPTSYMVQLPGCKRWRRVYSCCFSNAATSYVEVRNPNGKPNWHVILFG